MRRDANSLGQAPLQPGAAARGVRGLLMALLGLHILLLSPIREAQDPAAPLPFVPQVQAPVHMLSPEDAKVIFFSEVIQHL